MRSAAYQQGVNEACALLGVKVASSADWKRLAGASAAALGAGALAGAGLGMANGEDALPHAAAMSAVPAGGIAGGLGGAALGYLPGRLSNRPSLARGGALVGSGLGTLLGLHAGQQQADRMRDSMGTPEQQAARRAIQTVNDTFDYDNPQDSMRSYLDAATKHEDAFGRRSPAQAGAGGALAMGSLGALLGHTFGGTPGALIGGGLGGTIGGVGTYYGARANQEGIDLHRAAQEPGASEEALAARDAWVRRVSGE